MPGITGILSKRHPQDNAQDLRKMVTLMAREPFYRTGVYENEEIGVHAGWVCHPNSFCDCMPVQNETGDVILIFFGEDHRGRSDLDHLKGKNHRFKKDNASYIVHMYEEWGEDFLTILNGWFCGLIVDLRENKVILFQDRYGMQRLYVHETADAFYFSTEAKSILQVQKGTRSLEERGLAEFLTCGCVLENRTIFRDIQTIPAGAYIVWSPKGDLKEKRFFAPEDWLNQTYLDKEYFYERLREVFMRILPYYVNSNQDVAISLTGGLDSRMLLANMDLPAGKFPCYTFTGSDRKNYDAIVAKQVAELCNQEHHCLEVEEDLFLNFPDLAASSVFISDGSMDITGAVELYMNQKAREIASVRLTGNYGSELFRAVRHFKATPCCTPLLDPSMHAPMNKAIQTFKDIQQVDPLTFSLFRQAPWLEHNRLSIERSQVTLRTPFMDNELARLFYRLPEESRKDRELSVRLIIDGNPAMASLPTDRGVSCHQINATPSFLRAWRELTFKGEYLFGYGMPPWLVTLKRITPFFPLEKAFHGRHKFYHFRSWYQGRLSGYVRDVLLDERSLTRDYLNRDRLKKAVEDHLGGMANHTAEITRMLSLELINRVLIEDL